MFTACYAAAEAALADQAPAQAVEYLVLARSAAEPAGLTLDSTFHRTCGVAQLRVGQLAEARRSLETACANEPDPLRRGDMLALIAQAQHINYASADSVATVRRALAEIGTPLPRNPLMLLISTVALYVAGLLVGWTGYGFGTATGVLRDRYRVQATLCGSGSLGAAVGMRRSLTVAFQLRALYPVNRLGRGPEYLRVQAAFGLMASVARLRRVAARCFARAYAAAAGTGDPRLTAEVAWTDAVAVDSILGVGPTTGAVMRATLQEHGRWLDLVHYLGGVSTVGAVLTFRGYAHEAATWYERARARMGSAVAVPGNPITMLGVLVSAATGQRDQTEEGLAAIRQLVAKADGDPGQQVSLLIAAAHAAVERGETDSDFEANADEVRRLGLTPRRVWDQQRSLWLYLAWGRLARCRASGPVQRGRRLAEARDAVRELGRAANTRALRAYHHAAVAEYLQLAGNHTRALRRLARADLLGQRLDLPLLGCQTATVRAYVMRDLGHHAEAVRQARQAVHLAAGHGWVYRARQLRAEFRVSEAATPSHHTRTAGSATATGAAGRRLAALQQVSVAAATILDPDLLARVALDETIRIFAAERAILFLPDPHTRAMRPHLGRGAAARDLDQLTGYSSTLVEQVSSTGEALVMTSGEHGAALGAQSVIAHRLRSVMAAPLQLKGDLLGVVYLDSRVAKGVFTDDDVTILTAIAQQIAATMVTAQAAQLEATVKAAERQSELADTMRASMVDISQTLDPDAVIARLLRSLVDTIGAQAAVAVRTDGTAVTVDPAAAAPSLDRAVVALAARIDRPAAGSLDPVHQPFATLLPGTTGWLAVPLTSRAGRVGLLILVSTGPDTYHSGQVRIAAALAEQGAIAYDNAVLFSQVERAASTDALTGLHNRRHFFQLGADAFRDARIDDDPVAALMLDIDHFKAVNDTHGHGAGDDVIREVAARMRTVLQQGDLIGRYGGEEFAVLVRANATASADRLAEHLRGAVADRPVPTRSGPLSVTISVGVAHLAESDTTLDDILTHADQALYLAKRDGRNRVVVA
jgi:diguanylate cyclase (GGDEF)-like protein